MILRDYIVVSFLVLNSILDIWKKKISILLVMGYGIGAVVIAILEKAQVNWIMFAGLLPGLLLLGVSRMSREAVGYGDGLVILTLGLYTGLWEGIEVLFLAFFFSALWAAGLLILRRGKRDSRFPFVPFILIGYVGRLVLFL